MRQKSCKVEMLAAMAAAMLTGVSASPAQVVVAKLDGTSKSTFSIGALGATPLGLQNVSGRLTLGNGLRISGGTVDFSGATLSGDFDFASGSITGMTIDDSVIGGVTPAAGTFTSLSSTSGALNGTIGGTTPAAGAFTTVASSGQYTNTVSTGTAPLVVSSTTKVTNLNADRVDGLDLSGVSHTSGVLYLSSAGVVQTTSHTTPGTGVKFWALGTDGSVAYTGSGVAGNIWVHTGAGGYTTRSVGGDAALASDGTLTIGTGAITSGKILNGTILAEDIASNAVTTEKILDSNVTTGKIADASVTLGKLASDSVDSSKIVNGTIVAADLAASVKAWSPRPRTPVVGAETANVIRVTTLVESEEGTWLSSGQYMVSWVLLTTATDPTTVYGGSPTVTYVNGKPWQTITANKQAWAYTDITGQLVLDVEITGDVTVYLSVSLAGKTTFATLDFD